MVITHFRTSLVNFIKYYLTYVNNISTMNPQKMKVQELGLLLPPVSVRGMKTIDRDLFSKTIDVPFLEIDVSKVKIASKKGPLKKYMLKVNQFKPLQNLDGTADANIAIEKGMITPGNSSKKIIIFNPNLIQSYNDIDKMDREHLSKMGIIEQSLRFLKLKLTYNNWRADEILKAILPEDKDSVASYSIIGHIIHLNLRDHFVDYKQIIGRVLLDKISGAKTIVNKLDIIDNTFRNFQMEVLCGENDMMAQVRENRCVFEFDFSTVYWNPRLCTEHERVVKMLDQGDVLYDVFAGVGPFAIPAAKKKCLVLANDLNPESYKWLTHNAKLNKTELQSFNKDGADFIKDEIKKDMLDRWMSGFCDRIHITMNLPALAETFVGNFHGLFTFDELKSLTIIHWPVVHLYCFVKGDDPISLAQAKVEQHLGVTLDKKLLREIFTVRNVSPQKEMMRVSFTLSKEILVGNLEGPPLKKLCSNEDAVENGEKQIERK